MVGHIPLEDVIGVRIPAGQLGRNVKKSFFTKEYLGFIFPKIHYGTQRYYSWTYTPYSF